MVARVVRMTRVGTMNTEVEAPHTQVSCTQQQLMIVYSTRQDTYILIREGADCLAPLRLLLLVRDPHGRGWEQRQQPAQRDTRLQHQYIYIYRIRIFLAIAMENEVETLRSVNVMTTF